MTTCEYERKRQNSNCIGSLKNNNGIDVHTDKEILVTARDYYSELYRDRSSNEHDMDMFLDSIVPEKQLNEEMREKVNLYTRKSASLQLLSSTSSSELFCPEARRAHQAVDPARLLTANASIEPSKNRTL